MRMNTTIAIVLLVAAVIAYKIYQLANQPRELSILPMGYTSPATTSLPMYEYVVPTEEFFKLGFEKNGLAEHWDFFRDQLKPEIQMTATPTPESAMKPGQSKIGGLPDLPPGQEWFKEDNGKRLSFLAQVNLSEVAAFDSLGQLPPAGMLYFFYSAEQEAWGMDIFDKDKFKVFYFDGNIASLKRQQFPFDLHEFGRFKTCSLKFQPSVSLPDWEESVVSEKLDRGDFENYFEVTKGYLTENNKLLGHPEIIQNAMQLECELVTHGIYCGDATGYNDPRKKELEKNTGDWMLLFQLSSDDKAGMLWGDAGILYFWIKKEDLKNKRFDKCWMISQCS